MLRAGLAAIIAWILPPTQLISGYGKGSKACMRCKGSKRRQECSVQDLLLS